MYLIFFKWSTTIQIIFTRNPTNISLKIPIKQYIYNINLLKWETSLKNAYLINKMKNHFYKWYRLRHVENTQTAAPCVPLRVSWWKQRVSVRLLSVTSSSQTLEDWVRKKQNRKKTERNIQLGKLKKLRKASIRMMIHGAMFGVMLPLTGNKVRHRAHGRSELDRNLSPILNGKVA